MQNRKRNFIYIKISYKPKENNEEKTRLFGDKFVKRNKLILKIIYKNKRYDLSEYLDDIINNYNRKEIIIIKLRIYYNIINISYMFCGCDTLLSIQDIPKNKTINIFEKGNMTSSSEYNSFSFEKLNYSKEDDAKGLYYGLFNSISKISDELTIQKDDISNLIFKINLTDKNNTYKNINYNLITFSNIFKECLSEEMNNTNKYDKKDESNKKKLKFIDQNNTDSISGKTELNNIFPKEKQLSPFINCKFNYMQKLFFGCKSLISLPDISKWDTSNVTNMSNMFNGCSSLVVFLLIVHH